MTLIQTERPPEVASRRVAEFKPSLLQTEDHHLCPGCGEPVAFRALAETIAELDLAHRSVGIFGHGCYGGLMSTIDIDSTLCLHGRAPAVATGMKRMRPDLAIWTLQGDGDMVSEGLAEVMHTAARGESVTCFMLNNGVFGDTGGQMTAATVLGQRTKNTMEGRDASYHGNPIAIGNVIAALDGSAYVARGSVHNLAAIRNTKKLIRTAFERQMVGLGFGLVEILTMCPTGWFLPTPEGPDYMMGSLGQAYPLGVLKDIAAE